jgi:glycosyltransferase involved in cell wall biosynthesis
VPELRRRNRPRPSVSVILPTHNSASFVSRAIDSVLHQEGDHSLELIIVDDRSGDDTAGHIRQRYGSDDRIVLIASDRNAGPGAARNLALARAKGEWIGLIDADDAWTTDRLSALLPLCTTDVDVVFDNIIGFDQAGGVETGPLFPALPEQMTVPAMASDPAPGSKFDFGYLKPLVHRDFLRRTGIRYPEIRISEDLLFYLEILINGARANSTNEGFYVYTTSRGQVSRRRSTLSATIPDALLVSDLLDELAVKYAGQLDLAETDAISSRADQLRRLAPVNRLYENWVDGRYFAVARQCLGDPSARKHLIGAFFKRLRRMGKGAARLTTGRS